MSRLNFICIIALVANDLCCQKLLEYTLASLEQSGVTGEQLKMRRLQLETCPECRRKANMLDGENLASHRYIHVVDVTESSTTQHTGDQA